MINPLAKTAAFLLATTEMAVAHGSQVTHAHADWSSTIATVLAFGAFAALFIVPMGIGAKVRSNRHDSR